MPVLCQGAEKSQQYPSRPKNCDLFDTDAWNLPYPRHTLFSCPSALRTIPAVSAEKIFVKQFGALDQTNFDYAKITESWSKITNFHYFRDNYITLSLAYIVCQIIQQ